MTPDFVAVSAKTHHVKTTRRARSAPGGKLNPKGIVETYAKKGGWVDIDALVSRSVSVGMLKVISENPPLRHFYMFQPDAGGMVLVDARVSVPVATSICAAAQRAGVPIRRH